MVALSEMFREVIVLREIDHLSYREIAAIVDAPVGTVMSRLARGRAMLREAWLRAGQNDEQKKEPPGEHEEQLNCFTKERISTRWPERDRPARSVTRLSSRELDALRW
jgi:hypothetical protein